MYYNIAIYNSMHIKPGHKFHIDIYFKYNTNIYTYIYISEIPTYVLYTFEYLLYTCIDS